METMTFGALAVVVLVISGGCLYHRKPVGGLMSSAAALVLTGWTGYCWKRMLTASGKETALLGFHRYPAAVMILGVLSFLAIVGVIVHAVWIARRRKTRKEDVS